MLCLGYPLARQPVRSIAAWKVVKCRVGITRKLRPYDLRHAFATYTLAGGADIGAVAALMGHKSPSMILRVYQYVQYQQLFDAVHRVHLVFKLPEFEISVTA